MLVLLSAAESDPFLVDELRRWAPQHEHRAHEAGWVQSTLPLEPEAAPVLVFAHQALPDARECEAKSINAWADRLVEAALGPLPETQPWMLQVVPRYGKPGAGAHRGQLILDAVRDRLQRKRRHFLRHWVAEAQPFTPATSLVQLLLTAPERGWLSVTPAPGPYRWRGLLSPFPAGDVPVASDKRAPCRAFAKLVEAERRLGQAITRGERCVDLGASPGSWSYVALHRGARVIAVDRAPLRADLMRHPLLEFRQGDAFAFRPEQPVDWLLCDVIAAPERSIALALDWVKERRARRFVITIKFKGTSDYPVLDALKSALPPLCAEFRLTRLSANRNEACVFGETQPGPTAAPRPPEPRGEGVGEANGLQPRPGAG